MELTQEQIENRSILRNAMEKQGFTALDSEWWHFDFSDWEQYPIIR